mmetsp:Transcript_32528/g.68395  ORF Transcript_32528/g.68395 Transcript_32528/m.68395 type:complete len:557 (-) Transcript_32528:149-1819(-)|eukprot:CAMPEP_0172309096 /NCGR_PEP_ID=MMETSP1058-20130122/9488_1 /TAXON_ID=83371 /ORGANISM="Detonula confervacea, Strain CCMP 353" /LENGTH=556 /DNA_ID=CAMNT_0013021653 /DNA_START=323 /DNA_END=1993 /DNA_ORIENTATION=+
MGRRCCGRGQKKRGGKSSSRGPAQTDSDSPTHQSSIDINTPLAFGIGTRVKCPRDWSPKSLKDASHTVAHIGTVVGHWGRLEHWPAGVFYPYLVRLDCGLLIHNVEEFFRESDVPPMAVIFNIGSRVECKLGTTDKWFPGTVLTCTDDWARSNAPPYMIKFDYGRERDFWGPKDCIRASNVVASEEMTQKLRFKVGDRVDCRYVDGWKSGTVIKTWYSQGSFDNDHAVPYQIQIDTGNYIFAPADSDECVKKSTVPPPSCWICFDNEQSETNLILRECACRGEHNGFVHIDCLVKLAISKVDKDREPEFCPFGMCITCNQPFKAGSHCYSALTEAFYHICGDDDIGSTWNKMATTMMSELLISNEDYDGATKLLQERIALIRSKIEQGNIQGDDVTCWTVDLSNFLLDLAQVYEITKSIEDLKEILDESLALIYIDEDGSSGKKSSVLLGLARHATLIDEKSVALEYIEEAITLHKEQTNFDCARKFDILHHAGHLNIECNNRERGIGQLSEALEIITTVYGHDHMQVCMLKEELRKIREGVIDNCNFLRNRHAGD